MPVAGEGLHPIDRAFVRRPRPNGRAAPPLPQLQRQRTCRSSRPSRRQSAPQCRLARLDRAVSPRTGRAIGRTGIGAAGNDEADQPAHVDAAERPCGGTGVDIRQHEERQRGQRSRQRRRSGRGHPRRRRSVRHEEMGDRVAAAAHEEIVDQIHRRPRHQQVQHDGQGGEQQRDGIRRDRERRGDPGRRQREMASIPQPRRRAASSNTELSAVTTVSMPL